MANFLSKASAVIIVRDAQRTLAEVLRALQAVDEVLVYDNGSVDQSREIAASFPNVSLKSGSFLGFGDSKNHAANLARNDWIISLDADEVPDPQLLQSLDCFDDRDPKHVGRIARLNYCIGRPIRHSGWGGDRLLRVYHRRHHAFSSRPVHETLEIQESSVVVDLPGTLHHYSYHDVAELLTKAQRYSELYANSEHAKSYPFVWIVVKTFFAFIRSYVLKVGFLDGWRGFAIAFSDMVGVFFKYLKVYQRLGKN